VEEVTANCVIEESEDSSRKQLENARKKLVHDYSCKLRKEYYNNGDL